MCVRSVLRRTTLGGNRNWWYGRLTCFLRKVATVVVGESFSGQSSTASITFLPLPARDRLRYLATDGYRKLREQLIEERKLAEQPNGCLLEFTDDVVFSSPSAAAATVNAGNANGRTAWKVGGNSSKLRRLAPLTTASSNRLG
ncbi:DUF4357 domain-containing protein [Roseimaritima multifibrata]|nr:DUF4357 domain-containing protein [Roseimaritima multifibrata]